MIRGMMDSIGRMDLFFSVVKNFALLAVGAYLTTQLPIFRRALNQRQSGITDKLLLSVVFGVFSILGNYIGIPILNSLANHRIVGAVAGGLFGGPWVGLGAGALGALSRYFMGGFTMPVAVISNLFIGLFSGFVYLHYGPKRINLKLAMATAFSAELLLKAMILLFSSPFTAAWDLEKVIALPTMLANVLGVGLFVYVIRDVYGEQEKAEARAAHQTMNVLGKTHGILQRGLNPGTAKEVAQIIYEHTFAAAVALTDQERVLSFVGCGADHHKAGEPIITEVTYRALQTAQTVIENSHNGLGCPYQGCRLDSVIVTPLIVDHSVVGTLKLFKDRKETISLPEAALIEGMADVFSLELTQAKLNEQNRLLGQAKYNVLKAQVHPHFLFNILGTISALTRTNADKSRQVISDLAGFLRQTLSGERKFITLAEELATVHMYVRLEKVRYGDRIHLIESIPQELLVQLVPVFSLQPLVENAIRHGLSCKKEGGTIQITGYVAEGVVHLSIIDDGLGIPQGKLEHLLQPDFFTGSDGSTGTGLKNVQFRLQHLYGESYGLKIYSNEQCGTEITVQFPYFNERQQ